MESMERGGSTTSAQSPSLFEHLVALLESGRLIAEAFSISSACQSRVSGDTVPTSLELIFADESRFSQRYGDFLHKLLLQLMLCFFHGL